MPLAYNATFTKTHKVNVKEDQKKNSDENKDIFQEESI